jgi:serine/threonine protein kinase
LKPRELECLSREVALQTQISHPNTIHLYHVYEQPQHLHLLLELAPNGSLFQYLRREKSLSDKQIAFVFREVCKGIQALHRENILHRDIKPENILLGHDFTPKLADFGFACKIVPSERRKTICGTREYFAPEIFEHKDQSLKLDIWCLGILLYELCHNRAPFDYNRLTFEESAKLIRSRKYKYWFFFKLF